MWMVDPAVMCDQHLLGEHVELHMVVGAIAKGYLASIRGLINASLLDLEQVNDRHAALVAEMTERGMNHQSPLYLSADLVATHFDDTGRVHVDDSMREMWRRCLHCRALQRTNHAEVGPMDWIKPITHMEEAL